MLTYERLVELLDYDPHTDIWIWKYRPGAKQNFNSRYAGKPAGCINSLGYCVIRIDYQLYYAHRLSHLYATGEFPEGELDHIDRQRGRSDMANLREATRYQQLMNTGLRRDNTSGRKGVWFDPVRRKWATQIRAYGRRTSLGRFDTFAEACTAREQAEQKYHGEYAAKDRN